VNNAKNVADVELLIKAGPFVLNPGPLAKSRSVLQLLLEFCFVQLRDGGFDQPKLLLQTECESSHHLIGHFQSIPRAV
jgi:hypothetical protein